MVAVSVTNVTIYYDIPPYVCIKIKKDGYIKFRWSNRCNSNRSSIRFNWWGGVNSYGTSRYLFGGVIFGLGWAMTGACPGPMFVLLGHGVFSMLVVIVSALFGTFLYGVVKDKLPH